jgi:Leucine-rich repeat (LRR) protein
MTIYRFSILVSRSFYRLLLASLLVAFCVPASTVSAQSNSVPATYNCAAQTQIPAAECEALVALYNSATGSGWTNNTGWLATATPCSWFGVSCETGNHVTQLELSSNGLSGAIPVELGDLTELKVLILDHNLLAAPIPSGLGSLTNLVNLSLDSNFLEGSIPPEFGNLVNLEILSLNQNRLSGSIPAGLGNLSKLTKLDLDANLLTGAIPLQLGNLASLTQLSLAVNGLTGAIPAQLGNLSNLTRLNLCANQLTGSIPPQLGNLTNLTSLVLCHNQLTGSIPTQLSNLTNLTSLTLNSNQLSGSIPSQLSGLTSLTSLNLDTNQLTGAIPPQLGTLANLTNLQLSSNDLTGSIPVELGTLTNLYSLSLCANQLTGAIPAQLGNLTNLSSLALCSNGLTGSIPSQLGNLTGLLVLDLHANQLTGSFPSSFSNLTSLMILDLSSNGFSGPLPPQVGSLSNLTELWLHSNQWTGLIPAELGNLSLLTKLSLQGNRFNGEFPTTITLLVNLNVFTFDCWLKSSNSAVIAFLNNKSPGWQTRICPVVSSITRADASPTSLSSVNFTVTFSEAVTGVGIDDFALMTTGVSGAAITGVSGSGPTRTVSVNTGSGNGLLRLDVVDRNTIVNGIGNALGGTELGDGDFIWGTPYVVTKAATFGDVPETYWAWSFIERLYASRITSGCSAVPLMYCPEETVTRAEMAVFLERGIHGPDFIPPDVGAGTGFGDVPLTYWAAAFIKQLVTDGITVGCGGGNYCPENPVTRAQMAVFLLRSKYGGSYMPPDVGAGTGFGDVPPDYWAATFIKQLVAEGITVGCGGGNYCPEQPVTRAQMAVFLVRMFNLP